MYRPSGTNCLIDCVEFKAPGSPKHNFPSFTNKSTPQNTTGCTSGGCRPTYNMSALGLLAGQRTWKSGFGFKSVKGFNANDSLSSHDLQQVFTYIPIDLALVGGRFHFPNVENSNVRGFRVGELLTNFDFYNTLFCLAQHPFKNCVR